jgi:cupin 2 domain-containing protein
MKNMLAMPRTALKQGGPEFSETFALGKGAFHLKRIISHGHVSPEGSWYDQRQDEWAMILEGRARIEYPDGSETEMNRGDALFLPKGLRHRVAETSSPCIWLAVFADSMRAK